MRTTDMVVLFIDMLGVRSLWHLGGRSEVEAACSQFRELLEDAFEDGKGQIVSGLVDNDAAGIVFRSTDACLQASRRLYITAFLKSKRGADRRLWLRGAIEPLSSAGSLSGEKPLSTALSRVRVRSYVGDLLDAIAVEKSGFKGMRLLLHSSLVTPELGTKYRIAVGKRFLMPFRELDNSSYPARLVGNHQDYLWMASHEDDEWNGLQRTMASRLRWSARDSEEFLQAAATQVVFHECAAIIGSLKRGDRRDR
jgi:hypothetical protein